MVLLRAKTYHKVGKKKLSHLVGFILVGKVFRKALRILRLDERKGRWVVEQDFHGNFQVNVTWFLAFFSGVLN